MSSKSLDVGSLSCDLSDSKFHAFLSWYGATPFNLSSLMTPSLHVQPSRHTLEGISMWCRSWGWSLCEDVETKCADYSSSSSSDEERTMTRGFRFGECFQKDVILEIFPPNFSIFDLFCFFAHEDVEHSSFLAFELYLSLSYCSGNYSLSDGSHSKELISLETAFLRRLFLWRIFLKP